MSDDITISGGGTWVASDALLEAGATLAVIANRLDDLAHALRPALALAGAPGFGVGSGAEAAQDALHSAQNAARLAHVAAAGIRDSSSRARRLAGDLAEAAAKYSGADRDADARIMDLSTLSGWALGQLAPLAAVAGMFALPQLLATAATVLGIGTLATGSPQEFLKGVSSLAGSKASVLRDPRVVSLIRFAVSGADDAMLGAAGIPLPLAALVDDRGTRAFGLRGGTSIVVGAGRAAGLLHETPVSVERTAATTAPPPSGFADLAKRIPPSAPDSPQVRIERYAGADGDPAYIVYVGGTVDPSPASGEEPFDMTSDLVGIAQLDPASLRATEQAMQQAGIRPGDTVIPVGYSQGGIVATSIAVSGEYSTPALVTFGSPTAGIDVPSTTVDVAVEHTDDLVPALGGIPLASDRNGGDRIVVTRQTFSGEVPQGSSPIDAHLMKEYAITARTMDATSDPRLAAALAALPDGGRGDAELYRGTRVQSH